MFSNTVTSEQFEKLLVALGYELAPSNGPYRIYENREFDAMKVLPLAGKEAFARMEHLMSLRTVSIAKGIVDEETFDRLLQEISQQPDANRDAA
jgi:predicted RNA binding protein YcfA (HicA-like mRNA interferase family)